MPLSLSLSSFSYFNPFHLLHLYPQTTPREKDCRRSADGCGLFITARSAVLKCGIKPAVGPPVTVLVSISVELAVAIRAGGDGLIPIRVDKYVYDCLLLCVVIR